MSPIAHGAVSTAVGSAVGNSDRHHYKGLTQRRLALRAPAGRAAIWREELAESNARPGRWSLPPHSALHSTCTAEEVRSPLPRARSPFCRVHAYAAALAAQEPVASDDGVILRMRYHAAAACTAATLLHRHAAAPPPPRCCSLHRRAPRALAQAAWPCRSGTHPACYLQARHVRGCALQVQRGRPSAARVRRVRRRPQSGRHGRLRAPRDARAGAAAAGERARADPGGRAVQVGDARHRRVRRAPRRGFCGGVCPAGRPYRVPDLRPRRAAAGVCARGHHGLAPCHHRGLPPHLPRLGVCGRAAAQRDH